MLITGLQDFTQGFYADLCISSSGADLFCCLIFKQFWERIYASEEKRKMVEASGFYGAGWLDSVGCILADLQDSNADDGMGLYVSIQKYANHACDAGNLCHSTFAIT